VEVYWVSFTDDELSRFMRLAEAELRTERAQAGIREVMAAYAEAVRQRDWEALGFADLAAYTRDVLRELYEATARYGPDVAVIMRAGARQAWLATGQPWPAEAGVPPWEPPSVQIHLGSP
jgi:hypothetical protein